MIRTLSIGIVLMLTGLFSSNALAAGPDFNEMTDYAFNLSGEVITLSVPGRLDKDFPVKPVLDSVNIYDADKYSGNYYQKFLLERNWDYKGYFWQVLGRRYAMMKMTLLLRRMEEESFPNIADDMLKFKQAMISQIQNENEEENGKEYGIIVGCDQHIVNEVPVLKCTKKNEHPNWKRDVYTSIYMPIRDNIFLEVYFKIIPLGNNKDDDRHKWHPQAMKDIEVIMGSIRRLPQVVK